jgi:Family of unknown function (DUF5675)
MIIEINRTTETKFSIIGELITDGFKCFTLEPARVNPVNAGHPCINAGVYKVIRSHSPHLKYDTPELVSVPNRSDIRIHIGNKPADTLGCILVGMLADTEHLPDTIRTSTKAFDKFMLIFNRAVARKEDITVIISDHTFGVSQ